MPQAAPLDLRSDDQPPRSGATPGKQPPPLTERTRTAYWAFDEPRFIGHRVFEELAGHESWTGMFALSIFGRRLEPELCGVLDDAAGVLTLADPRIWPLKLTRVVGSYGGMLAALSAGVLAENEARIGPWACVDASKVLCQLHAELDGHQDDPVRVREVLAAYRKEHRFVWGFGTPYRGKDERVIAFRKCMESRGRHRLPYYRTMEAVALAMKEATNAEPNIGGVLSSALLDMGLAPPDVAAMVTALVSHCFFAHAIESSAAPNLTLRELPLEYVSYCGREPRVSPRARATEGGASAGSTAETFD
jgi:hypothetical protein